MDKMDIGADEGADQNVTKLKKRRHIVSDTLVTGRFPAGKGGQANKGMRPEQHHHWLLHTGVCRGTLPQVL